MASYEKIGFRIYEGDTLLKEIELPHRPESLVESYEPVQIIHQVQGKKLVIGKGFEYKIDISFEKLISPTALDQVFELFNVLLSRTRRLIVYPRGLSVASEQQQVFLSEPIQRHLLGNDQGWGDVVIKLAGVNTMLLPDVVPAHYGTGYGTLYGYGL